MSKDYYTAISNRRSIYALSKDSPISDQKIEECIGQTLKDAPSAFNSQSSNLVLLFGAEHHKLWNIVLETLRPQVPADKFGPTEEKIKGFDGAHGTVLYFIDDTITNDLIANFPLYGENFPAWAEQASGMAQFAIWTALELEGLGANLQHYNPLIDEAVKKEWKLPASWRLRAQMPFGTPTAAPGEKTFKPLAERLIVFS